MGGGINIKSWSRLATPLGPNLKGGCVAVNLNSRFCNFVNSNCLKQGHTFQTIVWKHHPVMHILCSRNIWRKY